MKIIYGSLILFILSYGCSNNHIRQELQEVAILSFSNPEKALTIIDSLRFNKKYHASYPHKVLRLLFIQTLHQLHQLQHSEDLPASGLIKEAHYFERIGDQNKAGWAYLYSGLIALKYGHISNASILLTEAQENAEKSTDSILLFNIYYQWGELYFQRHDQEAGKAAYRKALEYRYSRAPLNNTPDYLVGNCLLHLEQYREAQSYYQKIEYNLRPKDKKDSIEMSQFMQNIGLTYARLNHPEEAIEYIHKSCTYHSDNLLPCQLILANIYLHQTRLDSAAHYLKAIHPDHFSELRLKKRYYDHYAWLKELQNDYQAALKARKQQIGCQNLLYTKKPEFRIENIIRRYKEKKFSREKYALIYQRTLLFTGIIIISALGLLIIVYNCYLRKKKQLKYTEACQMVHHLQRLNSEQEKIQEEFRKILQDKLENSQRLALFCTQFENRYKSFLENYRTTLGTELNWQELYFAINFLHDNFQRKLITRFPNLDEKEIQVICLLRAGFHQDEIAYLMRQSVYTIHKRKTAIRKKTGIDERADIIESLNSFLN